MIDHDIDFDADDVLREVDVDPDFDFDNEPNPRTVVAEFKDLKMRRDEAKATFEKLDGQLKKAKAIVHDRMRDPDDIGMDTIKIKGLGRFEAPEPTWYAQVQDRRALHAWAREHRPGLLRTAEEQKLLNSLVRELIANQQALPPGLGAYPRKTVSVYKA